MPPADTPLTSDRILATAEDVVRRFGPAKATVVDVARGPGVSHAAVYRHVATKAELRDMVVGWWVEATMPPLRAIAARPGSAPQRLRRLIDALIAVKRRRAADDPELFAAYRTLAADAQSVVAAHVDELVGLAAMVIRVWREGRYIPHRRPRGRRTGGAVRYVSVPPPGPRRRGYCPNYCLTSAKCPKCFAGVLS
jgi:AcrR family transcriptional regulator